MPPISRAAVQFTQRIRNQELRYRTLSLIEAATKQPDLAQFTKATIKNPTHTSHTDPTPHTTVRLATEEQAARKVSQTIHIYHDKDGKYSGHRIYDERPDKEGD